ncbi:hypothetical protein ACSQ67_016454 [Phaseolus vulgaris]
MPSHSHANPLTAKPNTPSRKTIVAVCSVRHRRRLEGRPPRNDFKKVVRLRTEMGSNLMWRQILQQEKKSTRSSSSTTLGMAKEKGAKLLAIRKTGFNCLLLVKKKNSLHGQSRKLVGSLKMDSYYATMLLSCAKLVLVVVPHFFLSLSTISGI